MLFSTRTPLRISFFGGGTDYPEYFERKPGATVGMAIDKYVYISALKLNAPINYRYRLSYSKLEMVNTIEEIQHPVVREVLKAYNVQEALDINIMSDLPASSGLGSSSTFSVGFINLISSLKGLKPTKFDLAKSAIHIERDVLRERVGVQDQLHAAFGGINRFDFQPNRFRISPLQLSSENQAALSDSMLLVFTGLTRHASATLEEQMKSTSEKKLDDDLDTYVDLVTQAVDHLENSKSDTFISELGAMLHEGWKLKRRLSSCISNPEIDELYSRARALGAYGGKLCGAGGGGFLLLLVEKEKQDLFVEKLAPYKVMKIGMDPLGSTVIYS